MRNLINFTYDATFDEDGRIDACDLAVTTDAGWIPGLAGLLSGELREADAVFNWTGGLSTSKKVFLSNKPAITSMRAPGTMQASLFSGAVMDHIARTVGKDIDEIMEMNLYKVGDTTPQGDKLGTKSFNYTVPQLWTQIQESSQYKARKAAVETYNQANRWTKKGIAIAASKMCMPSSDYLMGAHLTAYVDGTVHVRTGGVEMGQGLNTKVILCVAQTLGIPTSSVRATGGDTRSCGNNSMTGGSGTSESCCNAAMKAATALKERLGDKLASGTEWTTAVQQAKQEGLSLTTEGWFNGIAFQPKGHIYAVYGAAVSEVMIDVLTGESRLERVDLLMDLGTQMDAAVDIGQVQGGFVQSLGYLFTEETKWDANGTQLFCGTWEYKVPSAYDIPVEFNVSLLKNTPNPHAMAMNSKAVAEPAMSLVVSPFLAAKKAIYAAREEFQLGREWFPLDVPVSPEAIRTAVGLKDADLKLPL